MSYKLRFNSPRWLFIEDTGEGMSITNDAEGVCEYLILNYGNKRIMYRDSDGTWDELCHNHGIFKRFEFHGYTDYDVDRLIELESVKL